MLCVVVAYVLITCELGSEENVIDDLKHIESVKEVQGTFGAYDIFAKLESGEKETLRNNAMWNIRNIKKIRSTLTLMGIEGQ